MLRLIQKHSVLLLLTAIVPTAAFAYVDPGSGHLLFQLMFAFVAGILFYLRSIIDWFRPGKKDTDDTFKNETPTTATTTTPVTQKKTAPVRKIKKATAARKKNRARKPAARKRA